MSLPSWLKKQQTRLLIVFDAIAERLTDALLDDDKIAKANLQQVAMSAGIAVDKARPVAECADVDH